ncbi:MAG: Rieske (2Fe-2S) protein [Steroidobacteraceae bacterium]
MIDVAGLSDLAEGALHLVRAGEARIVLCRIGDTVHAVGARCTHARAFLAPGQLDRDGLIECPMHGARFSPVDGTVRCAPATVPLPVHTVRIEGGRVLVDPAARLSAAVKSVAASPWAKWTGEGSADGKHSDR